MHWHHAGHDDSALGCSTTLGLSSELSFRDVWPNNYSSTDRAHRLLRLDDAWICAGSGALERIVLSGWIAVYFGIGFAFWVAMRQIGSDRWALATVVGMIVVTKFTDAGAYFTGRALGKTKLCPSISPGKTLEGLMGGMIVGVLVSWIYFVPFMSWLFAQTGSSAESSASAATVNPSGMGAILLGILLTLAGLIGDLLESMVKRETECKDSSRVLPGLGGLWDVTDSLIPAGVVGYLILASGLLHHTSH